MTAHELTKVEFEHQATALSVDPNLWDRLYPMVRDLSILADRLRQLAPELHQEIPVDALSGSDAERER